MNKKKLIARIIINIISIAVLVLAVYMLATGDLNQWQKNLSTVLVVVALPVIVIPMIARSAFRKYDNLLASEAELWETDEAKEEAGEPPENNVQETSEESSERI